MILNSLISKMTIRDKRDNSKWMPLLYRWGITNLLRRGDNPLLSDTLRERRLEQIRCTNISNGIQIPLRQKKMPSGRSRVLSGWRFLFYRFIERFVGTSETSTFLTSVRK